MQIDTNQTNTAKATPPTAIKVKLFTPNHQVSAAPANVRSKENTTVARLSKKIRKYFIVFTC